MNLRRTTMFDVLRALAFCGNATLAADLPCSGSIQAVSNALRHAGYRKWVKRCYPNETARRRNIACWSITPLGRKALHERNIASALKTALDADHG